MPQGWGNSLILLFNLNNYIGGGETLLIRLAQHLRAKGYPYHILTSGKRCWILEEATKLGLNCDVWPVSSDSINYQSAAQRIATVELLNTMYGQLNELRVFTFCMRDLHNALYVFTRLPHCKVWFSHGVYHPEDVFYLASLSLRPEQIVTRNRDLAQRLHDAKSILFMNHNGLKISLSPNAPCDTALVRESVFIPIPIPINDHIPKREIDSSRSLRIICISRFVDFKVAAVLAIMRFAANRPGVELLVIGHGPWEILLKGWLAIRCVRNISIITNVSPSQLDNYINTCDIGYAQGTSILEIGKRGLPVLIAPYSRIRDLFDSEFPTLGVFGEVTDSSAFGDITDLSTHKVYKIADCIDSIRLNYIYYQHKSTEFVNTFSSDIVCERIFEFIMAAKFSNQQSPFEPQKAPLIKQVLKMLPGFNF